MEFVVQQTLIIDGEQIINKGDLIKITTISKEVMQGEFIGADDFQEEVSICRRDMEWSFCFDEIEEIEVIEKELVMLDKIINEKLNKKGLKLLYWSPYDCDKGMWVVNTLDDKTKSTHFDLEGVVERWLSEESNRED